MSAQLSHWFCITVDFFCLTDNFDMALPIFRDSCQVCGRVFYSTYDVDQHCSAPCVLPAPLTTGMPLLPMLVSPPPQTSPTSLPTPTVAASEESASASPATAVISLPAVPPDGTTVPVTPPTYWATYLLRENRHLRQQNVDYKFLLRWCLHHLKSLPTAPPSVADEVDGALRRTVQHSTVMPPQVSDTSTFAEMVSHLHAFISIPIKITLTFPTFCLFWFPRVSYHSPRHTRRLISLEQRRLPLNSYCIMSACVIYDRARASFSPFFYQRVFYLLYNVVTVVGAHEKPSGHTGTGQTLHT